MKPEPPREPALNREHVQGGQPCWCGYQGTGILTEKKPRFAPRDSRGKR